MPEIPKYNLGHNGKRYRKLLLNIFFIVSVLGIIVLIYDAGYSMRNILINSYLNIYIAILGSSTIFILFNYLFGFTNPGKKAWIIDLCLAIYNIALITSYLGLTTFEIPENHIWLNIGIVAFFIRTIAALRFEYNKHYLNPAQLFIASFISMIFIGTFLLMLPNATINGITFLDALFTSTSAVCVTGLIVVDTGTFFTTFGQSVIALLIQTGGIGIMTFTSYFGYFFKGGASYQNRLIFQNMNNSDKIDEVFSVMKNIILVTIIIEVVGSVIIFFSLDKSVIPNVNNRIFFSIFHSVSGFCNAGFSTLPNSLYETGFRFNYMLHITIAILFIIGGLGFPIVFNLLTYVRHLISDRLLRKNSVYSPWIIGLNMRVVLITTFSLLLFGTVMFYIMEYNNTLAEHSGPGKIITAFFSASTPRTAGFNTVNTSALNFSTILIVIFLMWIGASPGSTGGGVKTSTFAISILNFLSIAKGKDRIEVFKREISPISARRAFAILSLSIIIIGISTLLLAFFDGNKGLLPIAFECFSAYSTVGLSLGVTSQLSDPGKLVIIFTMFIGRVSMLTILVAFLRRIVNLKYKYPTEDILIN